MTQHVNIIDRTHKAEVALHKARIELTAALAWVEHWQRDVQAGLTPTETSLARTAANLRQTIQEIEQ